MTDSPHQGQRGLLRQPGLAGLLFALGILLFSWPFWASSAYRSLDFIFPYLFLCWALLILVLLVLGRAHLRFRSGKPATQEEKAGQDV